MKSEGGVELVSLAEQEGPSSGESDESESDTNLQSDGEENEAKVEVKADPRNITILNIASGLLVAVLAAVLAVVQFVLKKGTNIEKTKDLLIKVCTSSPSDEATIAAHSMQLLETHGSDLLLYYCIYPIALIVSIAVTPIKNKAQRCLLCHNILTLLNIWLLVNAVTVAAKVYEGEPRQIIFSVCKLPDKILESKDCVETVKNFKGDIFENLLEETRKGYCDLKVARSLPSGHSSTAWAFATFPAIQLIIFAKQSFKKGEKKTAEFFRFLGLIALVIILVLALPILVMIARVQEHFHTWPECLAGMPFGIGSSLVCSIPFMIATLTRLLEKKLSCTLFSKK